MNSMFYFSGSAWFWSGLLILSSFGSCLAAESVQQNEEIVVASSNNFPPLNLLDDQKQLSGFTADVSSAVFTAAQIKYRRKHSAFWPEVENWLISGEADLIHDTGYTPERDQYLDFSNPIISMDEVIFVRNDQLNIHDLSSLRGKKVACVNNHITHIYLKKFDWINCHIVDTPIEGVHALISGRVDAYVYPREIVVYHLQNLGMQSQVKIVGDALRNLSWSMTVKQGNTALLSRLNAGIAEIRRSGEYDLIYKRWFGETVYVGYEAKDLILFGLLGGILSISMGFIFYVRNINKERQRSVIAGEKLFAAKTELEQSEVLLKDILNGANAIVCMRDLQGRYIFVNRKFEDTFGLVLNVVEGKTDYDLFSQSHAKMFWTSDQKVLEEESEIEVEERIIVNGEEKTYLSNKFCLRDKNFKKYAVCSVSTDISERKMIEKSLHESRQNLELQIAERTEELIKSNHLLQSVIDSIPTRVFWKDLDNIYLGCNEKFAKDAGFERPQELIGKSDFDMPWREQANQYRKDDTETMLTADAKLAYEEPQTTPDGSIIWLETSKIPLTRADGTVYGVLGTYYEITGRKKSVAEMVEAKELAEKASSAKSDFLANMSHELRTPLHGILGFAQLGEMKTSGSTESSIGKYFSQIISSGERLKVLLDDLLDISKLEAGKMEMNFAPVGIGGIIQSCVNEQRALLKSREIYVECDIEPGMTASCDKNRIGQVVMNILSNAIKFSPVNGTITIVASECDIADGDQKVTNGIRVCIIDQGPGVPEEERNLIFDKFIQSSKSKFMTGGTGLGLAICLEIVHAHSGKLSCRNLSGGGAEFCFELPVSR